MRISVAPAGDDLEDKDAVAKNIRFGREDAVQSVLRRHVSAAFRIHGMSGKRKRRVPGGQRRTHYVPAIRLVLPTLESMLNSFAKPKSEILGFMSASSKMLLALRSRWMIVSLESS